ncbi:hypothetical protein ACOME3_008706 [Neoechinorhynchus agilis]
MNTYQAPPLNNQRINPKNDGSRLLSSEFDAETSEFVRTLWKLDRHRPRAYWDYAIDLQAARKTWHDIPPPTLFAFVNEDLLLKVTSYRRIMRLIMMYENDGLLNKSESSRIGKEWQAAELKFIQSCYATPLMQKLHQYLVTKNKVSSSRHDFIHMLYKLWFTPTNYSQDQRKVRATLFERLFVGKTKQGVHTDFHFWLQYYLFELEGIINFHKIKDDGSRYQSTHNLISVDFKWADPSLRSVKHTGSIFIGTSPEFEMALYTLCIFKRKSRLLIHVAHANATIDVVRDGANVVNIYPTFVNSGRSTFLQPGSRPAKHTTRSNSPSRLSNSE